MVENILIGIIVLITVTLIFGQTFIWEYSIWTNIATVIGIIWVIFLLNFREVVRFCEIVFIEVSVRLLDSIAYVQGYKVCKADGHLLEEVYKLRHKVYLEAGYIEEPKNNNIFVDSYDPFSTNLVVLKDNQVIGTLRIIFYNKLTGLSTLNYFNLDIAEDDLTEYVDIGRWVNDPEYRAKKIKNPIVTILIGLKTYLYLLKSRKKFIMVMLKHPKLKQHIESVFNIKFQSPKILPLESRNHEARAEISGYFKRAEEVEVCVLELKFNQLFKFFIR